MNNNKIKDYLTLANDRYKDNKKAKEEKIQVEREKIKALNERQEKSISASIYKQKNNHINGLLGAIIGIVAFIIILGVLYVFASLISRV